ncbi:hypothetical protein EAF00_005015 [Botryotinia globosa]|nr:hypothetical protein EAF00_005015 [Botryotinia globosa]
MVLPVSHSISAISKSFRFVSQGMRVPSILGLAHLCPRISNAEHMIGAENEQHYHFSTPYSLKYIYDSVCDQYTAIAPNSVGLARGNPGVCLKEDKK